MSVEKKVKLLWDCATSLSSETHTNRLLKSYYINTCRKIAKTRLQVPKEKFAVTQMCPRCGGFWSESEFKLKLRPQSVANKSKSRSLIAKLEKSKEAGQRGQLKRKQRKRAKWLKKRMASNIEIHCEQCKHKARVPLVKPKKKATQVDAPTGGEELIPQTSGVPKLKKKKRKNEKTTTAGLKLPSVPDKEKKTTTAAEPKKAKNQKQTAASNTRPARSSNLTQCLKAKKAKKKNQTSTPAAQACAKPKVQSRTQQRNSLLQLAALLKSQTSTTKAADKTQNRLESLLK